MEEKLKCVICGETEVRFFNQLGVRLNVCDHCGLIWQPEIYPERTKEIYDENYMMDYTVIPSYYPMLVGRFFLTDTARAMFLKDGEADRASLLDVGCHTGGFLRLVKPVPSYFKIAGVDVNEIALKHLHGIPTYNDFFKIQEQFGIVTFFDSLEHFFDIQKTLDHLAKVIQPEIVIVSLPNVDVAVTGGDLTSIKDWHHYKPNEHIYYFNESTLTTAFKMIGYTKKSCTYTESLIRNKRRPDKNIITAIFKKN